MVGQTAAFEGHDADIPTETYSLTSTETFTTPTQEFQPTFSSDETSLAPPESRNATAAAGTPSLVPTADAISQCPEQSLPPQSQHASIPEANKDPTPDLLPSTISQWRPQTGSSAFLGNHMIRDGALGGIGSTGLKPALEERSEKKDALAQQKPSEFIAEAPPQTPKAILSTNPEEVPKQTSRPTTPTKPEALQASIPKPDPHYAQVEERSGDAKNVVAPTPETAATATHEAFFSTNAEKVSTSAIPVPNGKRATTSSDFEQEVDLEAGHHSEDFEKKEPETHKTEVDPNIIDWDGPDDLKNPINWSDKLKWANIAVIASITFLT